MRKLCLKLNNVEILHRRMGNLQGWMRYCFLVNRSLLLLLLLLSPCLIIIARFIQCTSVAVVVDRRERGSEGRRDGDGGGETEERERERERERVETGTKRQRRDTEDTEETCRETETERKRRDSSGFWEQCLVSLCRFLEDFFLFGASFLLL